MIIKLKVKKEFDVKKLLVEAGVRYWEDSTVNGVNDEEGDLIPCRDGDTWKPIIDLESGIIINWEKGKEADVHYKVCDDGEYWLLDENDVKITKAKGYYVPSILSIGENGYGDYIIMKIDSDGKISNWNFDVKSFLSNKD